ncbi:hypothetical protein [Ideonella sp.]|uniref:hypothetical protein n=1 Tax=Ideonella sp. TaxID=1929293 RepID=UPI0035AEE9EB
MKQVKIAALALAAVFSAPAVMAQECLQDQYGNQYNVTFDAVNKSITGVATVVQRNNEQWTLSGSYATNKTGTKRKEQQLTMTDSGNTNQLYMLRGVYPNFAWYYNGAYGAQEGTWVACGTAVAAKAAKTEGRQGVR